MFVMFIWDGKYQITGVFPAKTALKLITVGNNFFKLPLVQNARPPDKLIN